MNREFNRGSARMLLNETKAGDVMSSPAKTLEVNSPFSKVEEMFVNQHVRHLPIVDSKGVLVGIITQKDLYKLVSPRKIVEKTLSFDGSKILDGNAYYSKEVLDAYILKYVMTKEVYTLKVNDTVGDAIHSIVSHEISSVVIVDDKKKVLGIITTFDIIKLADKIFLENK